MGTPVALPPNLLVERRSAMFKRRRFKQTTSLHERLVAFANEARERAATLPPGPERNALLKKVSQADTASHLDDRVNSPALQAPK
jgi:hypothetical protein